MVYREKAVNEAVVERKKIISDITGKYPLVLMEIEMDEYLEPVSYQSYYYANNQILAQLQRDTVNSDWYYYLCDRLGSVRTLIDCNSDTVSSYTYDSFGNRFESETYENHTVDNPYQFAGYRWDEDAEMFYCNARWYNPEIYRFTGRDPVRGEYEDPLTLHAYLYCVNDPVDYIDPSGRYALDAVVNAIETYTLGVEILAAGVDTDNDTIFKIGEFVTVLTPVVYAVSLATGGTDLADFFGDDNKGLTPGQNALKNILKERRKTGKRLDDVDVDVDIIKNWAKELGLVFRDDRGTDHWIGGSHVHVDGIGKWGNHIPIN